MLLKSKKEKATLKIVEIINHTSFVNCFYKEENVKEIHNFRSIVVVQLDAAPAADAAFEDADDAAAPDDAEDADDDPELLCPDRDGCGIAPELYLLYGELYEEYSVLGSYDDFFAFGGTYGCGGGYAEDLGDGSYAGGGPYEGDDCS